MAVFAASQPDPTAPDAEHAALASDIRSRRLRISHFLPIALMLAAIILAFAPVYQADFVDLDDPHTVWHNKLLNPPTVSSLRTIWTTPAEELYIPVTYTVWAGLTIVSRAIYPTDPYPNPAVFHAFNVFTHAATSVIIYGILRLFIRNRWAAVAGAAVFALHPIQVESVAWVSGLKDLLWGFFGMLALWHYLLSVRAGLPSDSPQRAAFVKSLELNRGRARLHFVIATAAFVIAMLCKPTAMVTPALAAALDLFLVGRRWPEVLRKTWFWFLLAIPILITTRNVQNIAVPTVAVWARPLIATDALAYYLTKLVFPFNFTFDPGRRPDWTWTSGAPLYTWIVPATVALLIVWQRHRRPWLIAAALVFVIALLPVLGFVPFMYQLMSTVTGHYLYVSMFGVAIAAGMLLRRTRRSLYIGVYVVLLVFWGTRTAIECRYWQNSFTYYERMIAVNPKSFFGHGGMGRAYRVENEVDLALAHFSEAIEINPEFSQAHRNFGDLLMRVGNWKNDPTLIVRGLDHLRTAIELRAKQPAHYRPDDTQARLVLGQIYDQMGLRSDAEAQWRAVIEESSDPSTIAEARRRLLNQSSGPATTKAALEP